MISEDLQETHLVLNPEAALDALAPLAVTLPLYASLIGNTRATLYQIGRAHV